MSCELHDHVLSEQERQEKFEKATGRLPEDDDLERAFCERAGDIGHMQCGWCLNHDKPRLECGCLIYKNKEIT